MNLKRFAKLGALAGMALLGVSIAVNAAQPQLAVALGRYGLMPANWSLRIQKAFQDPQFNPHAVSIFQNLDNTPSSFRVNVGGKLSCARTVDLQAVSSDAVGLTGGYASDNILGIPQALSMTCLLANSNTGDIHHAAITSVTAVTNSGDVLSVVTGSQWTQILNTNGFGAFTLTVSGCTNSALLYVDCELPNQYMEVFGYQNWTTGATKDSAGNTAIRL